MPLFTVTYAIITLLVPLPSCPRTEWIYLWWGCCALQVLSVAITTVNTTAGALKQGWEIIGNISGETFRSYKSIKNDRTIFSADWSFVWRHLPAEEATRGWKYGMKWMIRKHTPILRDLNCFLGLSFHSGSIKALLFQISQWIQSLLNYRPVWNFHGTVNTENCVVSCTTKFYIHSWGFSRNWQCNSMDYCRTPLFCSQWLCYCRIGF